MEPEIKKRGEQSQLLYDKKNLQEEAAPWPDQIMKNWIPYSG
jgi:hypothetical protein